MSNELKGNFTVFQIRITFVKLVALLIITLSFTLDYIQDTHSTVVVCIPVAGGILGAREFRRYKQNVNMNAEYRGDLEGED